MFPQTPDTFLGMTGIAGNAETRFRNVSLGANCMWQGTLVHGTRSKSDFINVKTTIANAYEKLLSIIITHVYPL